MGRLKPVDLGKSATTRTVLQISDLLMAEVPSERGMKSGRRPRHVLAASLVTLVVEYLSPRESAMPEAHFADRRCDCPTLMFAAVEIPNLVAIDFWYWFRRMARFFSG